MPELGQSLYVLSLLQQMFHTRISGSVMMTMIGRKTKTVIKISKIQIHRLLDTHDIFDN